VGQSRIDPERLARVKPIVIALAPGVIVGTALVSLLSSDWLKFVTYITLLPLILLQAAGLRRPIQSERAAGFCIRRRSWRAVFRDDDFGTTARGGIEQPGARETGFPRGARRHPSG
jgi:uncharacterized membrane protein YfcA